MEDSLDNRRDAGYRASPLEVGRAKTTLVNLEDNELNVPKDEATKNDGHWNCSIKKRTATVLERWLNKRTSYDKYQGRDELYYPEPDEYL